MKILWIMVKKIYFALQAILLVLDSKNDTFFVKLEELHIATAHKPLILQNQPVAYPEHRSPQPSYPAPHSWHGHPHDPSGLCHGWLLPD